MIWISWMCIWKDVQIIHAGWAEHTVQCNHLESRDGCGELTVLLHFLCAMALSLSRSPYLRLQYIGGSGIVELHFSIICLVVFPSFARLQHNLNRFLLRSPVLYEYRFIFLLLMSNYLTENKCFSICCFSVSPQIKMFSNGKQNWCKKNKICN